MSTVKVRAEIQSNPVSDEVSALIAITRPILHGLLFALKRDIVEEVGGYDKVKLKMLPRLYRPGDGDCGICYEYAIHDAIRRAEPSVKERLGDALKICKVKGTKQDSILFGAEKTGAVQLIDTSREVLTDDSRLLTGERSQPPKLKAYLNQLAAAFSNPRTRYSLPLTINGLWKADLFVGCLDSDRWVGTSVKINPHHLEAAKGLRVGIVPAEQGKTDRVRKDEQKNLIICPVPYDGAFVELFYSAWGIAKQFIAADAQIPKESHLPLASHRQVSRELASRRDYAVLDVAEALLPLAQPELLTPDERERTLEVQRRSDYNLRAIIAPISRMRKK